MSGFRPFWTSRKQGLYFSPVSGLPDGYGRSAGLCEFCG